jgi:hypothetical protein
MARSLGSCEPFSFSRMMRPRWYMNHSSLRQSPFGSTAAWCHWSRRWVLVKEPFFSVWAAAGMRKTSVAMSWVRSSPVSISGERYQKEAVSISTKSRTTIQSRLAIAIRLNLPFDDPTAGFSPRTRNPFTCPSSIPLVKV